MNRALVVIDVQESFRQRPLWRAISNPVPGQGRQGHAVRMLPFRRACPCRAAAPSPPPGYPGGMGGLSGDTQVNSALMKLLEQNASGYRWIAATEGSQDAAPIELATGDAVMAIGGFNGTDPAPTPTEFEAHFESETRRWRHRLQPDPGEVVR